MVDEFAFNTETRTPLTPASLRNFHPALGQGVLVRRVAFDAVQDVSPTINGKSVNELITYLTDTSEGQSGAPVWLFFPNNGKRYLVAVHGGTCHDLIDGCKPTTRSRPTSNMGVLMTREVVDQINAWKQSM